MRKNLLAMSAAALIGALGMGGAAVAQPAPADQSRDAQSGDAGGSVRNTKNRRAPGAGMASKRASVKKRNQRRNRLAHRGRA